MAVLGIRAKKFVLLQERDLALFRWVSEQKFASQEQIQRRFWPNEKDGATRPDRVCYRRLCALVRFGFLERRHVVTDRMQLYQIGRGGLRELESHGEIVLPYLPSIDLKNYQHDLRVNEFRIVLEQMGATRWHSDRRIRQTGARSHTPDALFRLGENRCALEMELSLKRLDRYKPILEDYPRQYPKVNVVLYVCGSEPVRRAIRQQVGRSELFAFALWEDFARGGIQTEFEGAGATFRLEQML